MIDDETLSAEAIVGDDADKFLNSDLGKVVVGLAYTEATHALEELKKVSPLDADKIRELQNKIWRAESFEAWLRDLVREGEEALRSLQHDEDVQ